jgi:hypothetical protein
VLHHRVHQGRESRTALVGAAIEGREVVDLVWHRLCALRALRQGVVHMKLKEDIVQTVMYHNRNDSTNRVAGIPYIDLNELIRMCEDWRLNLKTRGKSGRARLVSKYAILARDGFKCVQCSREEFLTIDHIHGRAGSEERGKYNRPKDRRLQECQTLCVICHMRKNFASVKTIERVERVIAKEPRSKLMVKKVKQ